MSSTIRWEKESWNLESYRGGHGAVHVHGALDGLVGESIEKDADHEEERRANVESHVVEDGGRRTLLKSTRFSVSKRARVRRNYYRGFHGNNREFFAC